MTNLFAHQSDQSDLSYTYIARAENERSAAERSWCEESFAMCRLYLDKDFATQFSIQFAQRYWELYLCRWLLSHGALIAPKKNSAGPDFDVSYDGTKIQFEATCPTHGDPRNDDSVPQSTPATLNDDMEMREIPVDKIVLRYTSSLKTKSVNLKNHLGPDDASVIAVSGASLGYDNWSGIHDEPYIVLALVPMGPPYAVVDSTGKPLKEGRQYQDTIAKANGAGVSTEFFFDQANAHISGVLFALAMPGNRPDEVGSDFFFAHNPRAICPLPRGLLHVGTEFVFQESRGGFSVEEVPGRMAG